MSTEFKPIAFEDFQLSPEELTDIVTGAQKFLAPVEDEKSSVDTSETPDNP